MARSLIHSLERTSLQLLMSWPIDKILDALKIPQVVVDGCRLHPEIQLYLLIRKLMKKPAMGDLPPVESRKAYVRDSLVHGFEAEIPSVSVTLPGNLPARLYGSGEGPVIVYFHGGGFVIGDNVMFDHVYRYICSETGFRLLAPDYRKAPEWRFPQAVTDALVSYEWAVEHLSSPKFFIVGDSAGANLAAVVCQLVHRKKGRLPDKQLLFYPPCDWVDSYPSTEHFASGFFLTKKDFEYFAHHYHGGAPSLPSDLRISPLRGELKGLPSAIIVTAGFDPLRDQGDAYAMALKESGVSVEHIREEGMIHGFVNLVGFSQYARSVTSRVLSLLLKKS